jgi:ParB family transcriptional regulator, chromosome partitioning protein
MKKLPRADTNTGISVASKAIDTQERADRTSEDILLELIDIEDNVRKEYLGEQIDELANSILEFGLLQPISVIPSGTRYKIRFGHRRFLACKKIGKQTIRCFICAVEESNRSTVQLIENIQRENLSPIDLEKAVSKLLEEKNSVEEVAKILCKSKSWVTKVRAASGARSSLPEDIYEESSKLSSREMAGLASLGPKELPNAVKKAASEKNDKVIKEKAVFELKVTIDADFIVKIKASKEISEKARSLIEKTVELLNPEITIKDFKVGV